MRRKTATTAKVRNPWRCPKCGVKLERLDVWPVNWRANVNEVIAAYRKWKLCRIKYKSSLQRDGEKGPIVRRALRELINAKAGVRKAIEAARC